MTSGYSFSRWRAGVTVVLASVLFAFLAADVACADPPFPRYGTRLVGGDYGDWNLTKDFFSNMYRAGNPNKPLESWLYLRYDCHTNTLYVLVLAVPGVPVSTNPIAAWVAVGSIGNKVVTGNSGNDGVPPDFEWIDQAPAPGDSVAAGYEASFPLAPGTHEIIFHVNVYDDGKVQTSSTPGFPREGIEVIVDCTVPVDETSWGRIKSVYRRQ
jgi:hypothetical protein